MTPLDALAERLGVAHTIHDPDGSERLIAGETKEAILRGMGLELSGEEHLQSALIQYGHVTAPVLRAPPSGVACVLPDWLAAGRAWGMSLQLYELRSARNWGIGDFADLTAACRMAGEAGADFMGVNPLHALFLADPNRRSPFSPSNRMFLNPLYIAVDGVPGFEDNAHRRAEAERLRATDLVDYSAVTALKLEALREVFARLPADPRFEAFCRNGGDALAGHALFEALSLHLVGKGHGSGWTDWPNEFRTRDSDAVRAFREEHARDVRFQLWLQWVANTQLAAAAQAAREAGMRIGLYLDLAVGEAPDGSSTWSAPNESLTGITVGAPPDFFTADGQNWMLAAPSPLAMRETQFRGYRAMMEAAMRHAGAVRIDHAMGVWQLFLVPSGQSPTQGAHLRYPVEELLGVIAQSSQAHGTVVIGEDLGYVPHGFREVMADTNILSYRIFYFETDDGRFRHPHLYPAMALACLSTHDLPTLQGWWKGDDIGLRRDHGLIGAEAADKQFTERMRQRGFLLDALRECGLGDGLADMPEAGELSLAAVAAAHRFIARTPAKLVGVRLADLAGEEAPTNLPGTVDSYPNWQPKIALPLEEIAATPLFRDVTAALRDERPRPA